MEERGKCVRVEMEGGLLDLSDFRKMRDTLNFLDPGGWKNWEALIPQREGRLSFCVKKQKKLV